MILGKRDRKSVVLDLVCHHIICRVFAFDFVGIGMFIGKFALEKSNSRMITVNFLGIGQEVTYTQDDRDLVRMG